MSCISRPRRSYRRGATACRRVGTAARHQQHQFLRTSFGQPPRDPQARPARPEEEVETQAGWTTWPCAAVEAPATYRPRPAHRGLCAQAVLVLCNSSAPRARPPRYRAYAVSDHRITSRGRRHHGVPRPGRYLPVLWRSHAGAHPLGVPDAQRRTAVDRHAVVVHGLLRRPPTGSRSNRGGCLGRTRVAGHRGQS